MELSEIVAAVFVKENFDIAELKRMTEQSKRDSPFIGKFCRKYNVKLLEMRSTDENGECENLYIFDDNLGGYTIKGIKDSLV